MNSNSPLSRRGGRRRQSVRLVATASAVLQVALACNLAHADQVDGEPRNVLLLISDNQNWNDLGCYGNPVIQTPHLDQLAAKGTRFEYGFATTASCGPSRAVIYTGLLTHANGQYGHGHGLHTYRLMPNVRTVFQMLSEQGYRTALLGKQHTTPIESYPYTFDPGISGRDVMGLAKAGEQFIRESDDKPFFLVIGYSDPHPTSRDRPGWGIKREYDGVNPIQYAPDQVDVPSYLPDRPEVREGLAGYYQQISRMDAGVGAILQALDASGKADNTLVIFTSDHGSSEPGAMSNHYEPGIRVPFIVRHPKRSTDKEVNPALVTLADITPTILDWTNVDGPEYELNGRSILPTLGSETTQGWDDVVLSHVCHEVTQYYPMRTIRNRRFKLIWNINWRSEYPLPIDTLNRATWTETIRRQLPTIGPRSVQKYLHRDEVELYDLKNDPDEVINLADDPRFADVRRTLSDKLVRTLETDGDPWLERHRLPDAGSGEGASSRQANLYDEQGYTSLFNGKNLDGWLLRRADRGGYVVENGSIVCPKDGGGYLFTNEEFDNFSFKFEFRLSENANNGIAIRTPLLDRRPAYEGMEIQLIDNQGFNERLKPTQYHGSLYDLAPARQGALRPIEQWNTQEIRMLGEHLTVIVNDIPVLDVDLSEISEPEIREKHPGLQRKTGRIGLLGHDSRVEFRNLRVKRLEAED